jgi:NAD(P)-dependent dehydrogenase (short-subunit alcohol dehydrogenase family)
MFDPPFRGQTAIVTGGASGIGLATCRNLARLGANVVVADIDESLASTAAARLDVVGSPAIAVRVDVTDPNSAIDMVERVVNHFGVPHILINSAGIGLERGFLQTSLEEWLRILNVDLTGTFICSQIVARTMIQARYGRIVHLASTAGIRGGTGRAAYGAAKGGVISLTRVMAVELAEYGITVNAVAPGAIETELVARMHSAETRRVYRRGIPLFRYGTPDETAAAIVFLASRDAGYVTGDVLAVDGGFLAAGIMHRD